MTAPLVWLNHGASAPLSNGNKSTDPYRLMCGAVGSIGRNAANVAGAYYELTFGPDVDDGHTSLGFGFSDGLWDYNDKTDTDKRLGWDIHGWMISTNSGSYSSTLHNNGSTVSTAGLPTADGQDFGQTFGVLLKAGNILIYGTGIYAGVVIPWNGVASGTLFPAVGSLHYPGDRHQLVTVNGGDSPWVGSLPAGALAWNDDGTSPSQMLMGAP